MRAGFVVAAALAGVVLTGCVSPDAGTRATVGPTALASSASRPITTPTPTTKEATVSPTTGRAPMRSAAPPSKAEQARLDDELRVAAWKNDVTTATDLIQRGADVNAQDSTLQSAYLIATSEGYLDLLRLTLRHGAKVDDKDSWNGTGLIRAAERGHALVVGELLEADIDRDHVNRIGYQAVHEAVWLGRNNADYVDTVRALVAGGVSLTTPSRGEGLTPLQMARQRGFPLLEGVLAKATAAGRVAEPDVELLRAAADGDPDRVALALRAGATIETRDRRDRTALLLAVTADHVDTARLLVAMGASADALDDRHDTPWLVTGVTGSVAMLEALLPADPDLTIVNRYGGVSVIPASERGHADYVARVVTTGIDVNHVNRLGWTALLEAVILGDGGPAHQRIVATLLGAGADPALADQNGVTALQHARSKNQAEIVALLKPR